MSFLRKMFGINKKKAFQKIKVPKFKNSAEYFLWKQKVMNQQNKPISKIEVENINRIKAIKSGKINSKALIEQDLARMNKEVSYQNKKRVTK